jgi:hypothetical protein
MTLSLTLDTKDSLFDRHVNPLFLWRFRIPEEKVHGGIAWKPSEVGKTPIKISL